MGNALLRKARTGGYKKEMPQSGTVAVCEAAQKPQNPHSLLKGDVEKSTFLYCEVIPVICGSDNRIRCEWLLDLHAAFKAKSRDKKTHNLHYSWGTEDKGHSSVVCLPPSPASRESVFETTTFYRLLD